MSLGIPSLFPERKENLFSFDYADVVSGQSYVKFYCNFITPKATVYESYTTNDDTDNTVIGGNWFAQTFLVGNTGTDEDFWVNGCELLIDHSDTNLFELIVSIQALDGADKPDGTDLAWGRTETAANTNDHWHKITFEKPALLSSATSYALVIREGTGDNILIRSDNSAPSYTGGSFASSGDTGVTWTLDTSKDLMFKILGDTRPSLTFTRESLAAPNYNENDMDAITYTSQFTQDIDLIFNQTNIIKGDVIIKSNVTVNALGNNEGASFYYDFELIKISGGVETSLGTATSEYEDFSGAGGKTFYTKIFVENQTLFKKNDVLRLKMELFSKTDDGQSGTEYTVAFGSMTLDIPFKLTI